MHVLRNPDELREQARQLGIKIVDLARVTGLDVNTIGRTFGGKTYPNYDTLNRLNAGLVTIARERLRHAQKMVAQLGGAPDERAA